jgi:membrane associated rhomboid family serine protease
MHTSCVRQPFRELFAVFLPIGDNVDRKSLPIVPGLLILANVLVFAYQMRLFIAAEGDFEAEMSFMETWGLVPAQIADGQVIGVLSYMFVHGGVAHLLGNMFVLWAFACSLEVGFGPLCFLALYVFWGIGGGLAEAAMNWESEVPVVGASGAIAGLIGAYTVLYGAQSKIKTLIFISFHPFIVYVPAIVFGLGWFAMQLWDASNDPHGLAGIAWYAHIGGFALGAGTTWLMRNQMEHELVTGTDGQAFFKKCQQPAETPPDVTQQQTSAAGPAAAAGDSVDSIACTYCGTHLDDSSQIAPGLFRCPDPACERLVYAEAEMATS